MEEIRARELVGWATGAAGVSMRAASRRMGRPVNYLGSMKCRGVTLRVDTAARLLETLGGELRLVREADGDVTAVRAEP